jgi:hypothetical protein
MTGRVTVSIHLVALGGVLGKNASPSCLALKEEEQRTSSYVFNEERKTISIHILLGSWC